MALIDAPALDDLVARLAADPRLVHVQRLPARPARTAELHRPLPSSVRTHLGIDQFWSHQARAIDLVRDGTSVAIATGTASGKSLCYQAPIAESIVEGLRPATSMLLFPTKALAQDQVRALTVMGIDKLVAATYDGDSTTEERTWVRQHANVVLTNPEMLHHGILPNHGRWATYLMRLRYVVVDELHLLRGVFGGHAAHLLRRLRRVCAHYGSDPVFVFSSATIGRPEELASQLIGRPVTAITDDGSPRGERLFLLWNPSAESSPHPDLRGDALADPPGGALPDRWTDGMVDHHDGHGDVDDDVAVDRRAGLAPSRRRASANRDTAALVADLVRDGHRTIAFCRSRKGTEIVAADIARRLPPADADLIRPYRAGYLTSERREIEADLFSGRLRGVVATTALELGVDIGGLDACVLDGFPGTIASMWQQAGRAGRAAQQSLAVLVGGDDQLDQWYLSNPDEVFSRSPEPAVINCANPHMLLPHLACAAYELPLTPRDELFWPDLLDDGVRELVHADHLRLRRRGRGRSAEPMAVWAGRGWPADRIGLRGSRNDEVRIALHDGTIIGTVDGGRACHVVHPGAIYLHRGRHYLVDELDLDDGAAIVRPHPGGEHTQPRAQTDIAILDTDDTRSIGGAVVSIGVVRVVTRVVGYRRIDTRSGELLAHDELHLPPSELVTRGFWYTMAPELLAAAGVAPPDWAGALHAVEHAGIGILPLFTICDRWDVGGVSTILQADTGQPTIVIHDAYPGGTGIAELAYGASDEHLRATLEVIEACSCETGCPSCVQSPKCGNGNEPLDKAGARAVLHAILDD